MKIKKGDKVIVIAGKDKGKTGLVLRAFPSENKVIVEGINIIKKHQRANQQNRKGQIVERSVPMDVSNVMISDPKTNKPTRVRIVKEGGVRRRVAVKSGTKID
ncbi:50S ribosomal protein L24 [Candidatus Kaiserbacteria bacterium CG10_big_fil_rev_8_21_14_0_10_43_70]|uniref:Large ribosomal subunit protein uL24 n=1 Tax=Candidatus Kaiserbacteria bacterium CG10_big_fil_rev_8_21_14_0_10_43_70 TaxID=1974605 RepID=A0A2H0UJH0_9BACT|nr:MAG: 50S ribosomal protein L24 [Candidatus Kaiserbacteria bacterium CG10_big_fil_rev_8_21_14_0_10_43_70]